MVSEILDPDYLAPIALSSMVRQYTITAETHGRGVADLMGSKERRRDQSSIITFYSISPII